jgi:hypothetical protein
MKTFYTVISFLCFNYAMAELRITEVDDESIILEVSGSENYNTNGQIDLSQSTDPVLLAYIERVKNKRDRLAQRDFGSEIGSAAGDLFTATIAGAGTGAVLGATVNFAYFLSTGAYLTTMGFLAFPIATASIGLGVATYVLVDISMDKKERKRLQKIYEFLQSAVDCSEDINNCIENNKTELLTSAHSKYNQINHPISLQAYAQRVVNFGEAGKLFENPNKFWRRFFPEMKYNKMVAIINSKD